MPTGSQDRRLIFAASTLFLMSLAGNVGLCLLHSATGERPTAIVTYPWLLAHCALLGAWVGLAGRRRVAAAFVSVAVFVLLTLAHSHYWFVAVEETPWTVFDWIVYFSSCFANAVTLVGVWVGPVLAVIGMSVPKRLVTIERVAEADASDEETPVRSQFTIRTALAATGLVAVVLSAVYSLSPYPAWIGEFPAEWWKGVQSYGLIHLPAGVTAVCLTIACIYALLQQRFTFWRLLIPAAVALIGAIGEAIYFKICFNLEWSEFADSISVSQLLICSLLLALFLAIPLLIVRGSGFRMTPHE